MAFGQCLFNLNRYFFVLAVPAGVWVVIFKKQLKKLKPYSFTFTMTMSDYGKIIKPLSRASDELKDFRELAPPNTFFLFMHYVALSLFLTAMALTVLIDTLLLISTLIYAAFGIPILF